MSAEERSDVLRKIRDLVIKAEKLAMSLDISAVAVGRQELGSGLSTAKAGADILLQNLR